MPLNLNFVFRHFDRNSGIQKGIQAGIKGFRHSGRNSGNPGSEDIQGGSQTMREPDREGASQTGSHTDREPNRQ